MLLYVFKELYIPQMPKDIMPPFGEWNNVIKSSIHLPSPYFDRLSSMGPAAFVMHQRHCCVIQGFRVDSDGQGEIRTMMMMHVFSGPPVIAVIKRSP